MEQHAAILQAVKSLEYNYGKNTVADFLAGNTTPKIREKKMNELENFGILSINDRNEIIHLLDGLIHSGYLELKAFSSNKFAKVVEITKKGIQELEDPQKDILKSIRDYIEPVTENDRTKFTQLGPILDGLSEEQKKVVIDNASHILCIAGAGSGKTRSLTRRIEFLAKYKGVPQKNILAITFTRKARQEMQNRLGAMLPDNDIRIETFNSFAEKELQKYSPILYTKPHRVMSLSDKFTMLRSIAQKLGHTTDDIINKYFSKHQQRGKEKNSLLIMFMNDLSAILDYFAFSKRSLNDFPKFIEKLDYSDKEKGHLLFAILKEIPPYKRLHAFRDYTDQIVHLLDLYERFSDCIAKYDHVLVDEYQDVNDLQLEFIRKLNPPNLFVVGDPRQSIFGWRGSKVAHIMQFFEHHPNCKIIELLDNYRSSKQIVDVMNTTIKQMKFSDIKPKSIDQGTIELKKFDNEQQEAVYIAQEVLKSPHPKNEIYILSRTNKQLQKIADTLDTLQIRYLKRTLDEMKPIDQQTDQQVLLSTVHAVKGLEAEHVFLIGCNANQYPCMVSDHPIIDAIKADDDYDKFSEEHRLLYVGLSRAKSRLTITHTTNLTSYIPQETLKLLGVDLATASKPTLKTNSRVKRQQSTINTAGQSRVYEALKSWRLETSKLLQQRAYMVFSDRTLTDLCDKMPMTLIELEDIYGLGGAKIMRFGRDIVEIIKEHA